MIKVYMSKDEVDRFSDLQCLIQISHLCKEFGYNGRSFPVMLVWLRKRLEMAKAMENKE